MTTCRLVLLLAAVALMTTAVVRVAPAADEKKSTSVLDFKVKDIDGKPADLAKYKGEVLLIVNVASYCGNTKQYIPMESVYEKYKSKGFEVLAFPANEFGHQEPGTDAEIKQFCTVDKYKVTFPLFSKIVVKGEGIHPLYQFLTSQDTKPVGPGNIDWNFAKFVVNRKGEVVARFKASVSPDSEPVVKAIEAALAEPK
jgi:glutathione peroxidase